jgi:hypothetical protein
MKRYLKAGRVHEMATWESFDRRIGCEEKVMANWAIGFQPFFSAYMFFELFGHAGIASHAMEVVYA